MKSFLPFLALLAFAAVSHAQESLPSLQTLLTPSEWKRAGLDKLSPDEIGVIDAALIRHAKARAAQVQTELQAVRAQAAAQPAAAPVHEKRFFERFGLPVFDDTDWRNMAPLKAKVVAWETPNRFRLDNGQVWEGLETIPFEILNREIEIHARPHSQFVIVLDGKSTTTRVFRLR